MTDNSVKIFGIFNESGELLRVFTNQYDAMDFLVENSDKDTILYITTGVLELPEIEE